MLTAKFLVSTVVLCAVLLPKSGPGSMMMRLGAIPSAAHWAARSRRNVRTSSVTSPYVGSGHATRGCPRMCMITTAAPDSAATRRRSGSSNPLMLLMIDAPASMAASATRGRRVSTDTGSPVSRTTAATTGITRSNSSSTVTIAPGPAFSPPMSMMSAPSVASSTLRAAALSTVT